MKRTICYSFAFIAILSMILYSCSKGGGGGTVNACAGVTITVSGSVNDADAGSNNGSISASATGGSGSATFSIDGGGFQTSGSFSGLAKGSHTVTAKDSKGCTGSKAFTVGEKNNCAGVTITVTATGTTSDPCTPDGTITASATGSTGFSYSIGSGTFQTSTTFSNIAPGTYTVNAKDGAGCTSSVSVTLAAKTAGPLFTAAKAVITANCALPACHSGASATGGINFAVDCNIVLNKDRIKARAIDANPSIMPPTGPILQADKDKLTAWINAGGKFTD